VLLGVAAAAAALLVDVTLRLQLRPDYGQYVGHGLGLYPSPVGRLLGALQLLLVVNACCAGAVVYLIARARRGRLWIVASAPVLFWLFPAGVDAAGTLLAVAALSTSSPRRAAGWSSAALLVHPVAAVGPLADLGRRRPLVAVALVVGAVDLASFSRYRALLELPPIDGRALLVALSVGCWSLVPAREVGPRELLRSSALGVAVYLVASTDHGVGPAYLRYALPLVVHALIEPSASSCKRRTGHADGRPDQRPAGSPALASRPERPAAVAAASTSSSGRGRRLLVHLRESVTRRSPSSGRCRVPAAFPAASVPGSRPVTGSLSLTTSEGAAVHGAPAKPTTEGTRRDRFLRE
jgi:hypothetical protein